VYCPSAPSSPVASPLPASSPQPQTAQLFVISQIEYVPSILIHLAARPNAVGGLPADARVPIYSAHVRCPKTHQGSKLRKELETVKEEHHSTIWQTIQGMVVGDQTASHTQSSVVKMMN
jgi:hypothetical protein